MAASVEYSTSETDMPCLKLIYSVKLKDKKLYDGVTFTDMMPQTAVACRRNGGLWMTPQGKWVAEIISLRVALILGIFDTPEEAALAYDEAASSMFPDYEGSHFEFQSLEETLCRSWGIGFLRKLPQTGCVHQVRDISKKQSPIRESSQKLKYLPTALLKSKAMAASVEYSRSEIVITLSGSKSSFKFSNFLLKKFYPEYFEGTITYMMPQTAVIRGRYGGVRMCPPGRWVAETMTENGIAIILGKFDTPEDAALAYFKAASMKNPNYEGLHFEIQYLEENVFRSSWHIRDSSTIAHLMPQMLEMAASVDIPLLKCYHEYHADTMPQTELTPWRVQHRDMRPWEGWNPANVVQAVQWTLENDDCLIKPNYEGFFLDFFEPLRTFFRSWDIEDSLQDYYKGSLTKLFSKIIDTSEDDPEAAIYEGLHLEFQSFKEAVFRRHSRHGVVHQAQAIRKKQHSLAGNSSQKLKYLPIAFPEVRNPSKANCRGSNLESISVQDGESSQNQEHVILFDQYLATSIELASRTPILNQDNASSDSSDHGVSASAPPGDIDENEPMSDIESGAYPPSQSQRLINKPPFDIIKLNKIILLLSAEEGLALLAILLWVGNSLPASSRFVLRGAGISSAIGFYSSLGSSILKYTGAAETAARFLMATGCVAAACGFTSVLAYFCLKNLC